MRVYFLFFFFFFQAEDGIRDVAVTGVQTCALPISTGAEVPGANTVVVAIGGCMRERGAVGRRRARNDRAEVCIGRFLDDVAGGIADDRPGDGIGLPHLGGGWAADHRRIWRGTLRRWLVDGDERRSGRAAVGRR